MLLWNYSVIHKSPWKFLWWIGAICDNNWGKNGQRTAIYTNSTIPDQWGLPVWYSTGWMLPRKSGYVVAFSEMNLTGNGTAVMGVNGDGESFIQLTANADLSLVVSSTGICNIVLTLTGQSVGVLYGTGTSEIVLWATGTLWAVAFSTWESNIILTAEADISAIWYMTGEMTPFTELSPENLAKAVWSALASENNDIGTMGAKLNTASSWWVDLDALAQAVWEYGMRSLTESAGLTTEQANQLTQINDRVDIKVSTVWGGGGGYWFSSDTIQRAITNAKKEIIEKTDEIKEEIVRNKPKDIDFSEILDKIEEIPKPIQDDKRIEKQILEKVKKIEKVEKYVEKKEQKEEKKKKDNEVILEELKKIGDEILEEIKEEKQIEEALEDITEESQLEELFKNI